MKKNLTIFVVLLFTSFFLTSCNNVANGTKKTVGDWNHFTSKNMGGYQISMKTKLSINRNGPGDYDYSLSKIVTYQMYGGQPKTEYSTGKIDEIIDDGKWKFVSGNFSERGGYIVVPSDTWEDDEPTELFIRFASGRGNSMSFRRY